MLKRSVWGLFFPVLVSLAGCGKSVDIGGLPRTDGPSRIETPSSEPPAPSCSQPMEWAFVQPQPTENLSVDLLFVVDSSDSLIEERGRVAAALSSFVGQLGSQVSYRVGVMLAHGGASPYSGRLFAGNDGVSVLSSDSMSRQEIQARLERRLESVPKDRDVANGEMLMYSLLRSLEPANLASIRRQGFYRDPAALAVIFVTDENDACYRPEVHGWTQFPDYVAAPGGVEVQAYSKYCLNGDGSARVTGEAILASLRSLKPDGALVLGSVAHVGAESVPRSGEDAVGHGIIELVSAADHGIQMEISQLDFTESFAALGEMATRTLKLETRFRLDGSRSLDSRSLTARVDGVPVDFTWDEDNRIVQIQERSAGSAGSRITIAACGS